MGAPCRALFALEIYVNKKSVLEKRFSALKR